MPSYSTPAPSRPRPTRDARAAAPACIELDSDPISTARFSTPRPHTAKRLANTAFHVPSAKKTKVVRVKQPPPRFSLSESPIQDSPRELGVLAAHPTLLVPTCASDERAENAEHAQAKVRHADEHADAHDAHKRNSQSLRSGENLAKGASEPEGAGGAAAEATPSAPLQNIGEIQRVKGLLPFKELALSLPPPDKPPSKSPADQLSVQASGDRALHEVARTPTSPASPKISTSNRPTSQLAVRPSNAAKSPEIVVSPQPPSDSLSESPAATSTNEPGALVSKPTHVIPSCGASSSKADAIGGRKEKSATPACAPASRPPKFSLSPSPSPMSPRELGVLAAHPTLVIQTCATDEFAHDSDAEPEHFLTAKRALNLHSEGQPEHRDFSEHRDEVDDAEITRPADTQAPAIAHAPYCESQREAEELSEHSDRGGDVEIAASADPRTPAVGAAVSPLNADSRTPLPASTPGPILCEIRRDCGGDPKNRVLVPETPSDERQSPALVEETPSSEPSPAPDSVVRTPRRLSGSTVTPAVSSARGVIARRSRQTPPLFAGSLLVPQRGNATTQPKQRARQGE